MSSPSTAIVWFRRDLRLADNPALSRALAEHGAVVPVYIHDTVGDDPWPAGGASRWWLHHSLAALSQSLARLGNELRICVGEPLAELRRLLEESGAVAVYWNRLYEPAVIRRDSAIKTALTEAGISVNSCNSALLAEPWQIANQQGLPFRVFTPFWKAVNAFGMDQAVVAVPRHCPGVSLPVSGHSLDGLGLLPQIPWDEGFQACWQPGEQGAQRCLQNFLGDAVRHYSGGRDHPGQAFTSRLSPHLHFGDIGPRQLVAAAMASQAPLPDREKFLAEVGWREFGYHLLYHFPETTDQPLNPRFQAFPWRSGYADDLRRWQRGMTGIPIVDAGMRELWVTGWMHNRVRMLVASLLTKNLLIPWQEGARWFWDTLVDADLASNILGWQWTAGCGADAAPYFRIFNPVLQGQKFDADGAYVRRWVPELAKLPDKHVHAPWQAPAVVLRAAGVSLGEDYPLPIVDLKDSRREALARFEAIKSAS